MNIKFYTNLLIIGISICSHSNVAANEKYTSKSINNQSFICRSEFVAGVEESPNKLISKNFTDKIEIKVLHISKIPIDVLHKFKKQSLEEGHPDTDDGLRTYTEQLVGLKVMPYGYEENSHFISMPFYAEKNFNLYLRCSSGSINGAILRIDCMNGENNFHYLASTGKFQYSHVSNWIYHDRNPSPDSKGVSSPSYFAYGSCKSE